MKLNKKDIFYAYNKAKKIAINQINKGNTSKGLELLHTASIIAYTFNFIYKDSEIENIISIISNKLFNQPPNYKPISNRFVFYDDAGLEKIGLTQQYIRALNSWNVDYLYILDKNEKSYSNSLFQEIRENSHATLCVIDYTLSDIERATIVYNKIISYRPEKAFIHIYPHSVQPGIIWNALSCIKRYYINTADHCFWIGVNFLDYLIEFRDYGCVLSKEMRQINPTKLLLQQYYPIITKDEEVFTLPNKSCKEDIVILTGGSYYKMYGDNYFFFSILLKLVECNKSVIIWIAGTGEDKPLKKFIKENKLQHKITLIGQRKDINKIFSLCDIYLGTYPIAGGLMSQYAAQHKKPILAYCPKEKKETSVNSLFKSSSSITFDNLHDFFHEANLLISNKEYRNKQGEDIHKLVITPEYFNKNLQKIIYSNTVYKPKNINNNYDDDFELYLEIQNNYYDSFRLLILSKYRFMTFYHFPKIALKCILSFSFSKHVKNKICNLK